MIAQHGIEPINRWIKACAMLFHSCTSASRSSGSVSGGEHVYRVHPISEQTSILHDNFCLSMICSDNDVEKLCLYFLICNAHMNLNYTIYELY
jgi:hypothetical protein